MALNDRTSLIVLSAVILCMGIIHLSVGIGIVVKYQKFGDIFAQQVGLSGYNIFIGLCAIILGILGFVFAINQSPFLSKMTAIASFVLGIFALASLISALALSGEVATHLNDRITDNMNRYAQNQDATYVIDRIQTTYQCCGVNLWLDWAPLSLDASTGRSKNINLNSLSIFINGGHRRKRQDIASADISYNLPSTYTVNLPSSCCRTDGVAANNPIDCVYNADNKTKSLHMSGCMKIIVNMEFSQIAGIVAINTCLTILVFLNFAKLITVFSNTTNSNNEQPIPNEINQDEQQQQQYPNDQYYQNYDSSNPYYISNDLIYKMYL